MGRSLRLDAPGAWHHVMNRGAGRRSLFRTDADRRHLVSLVAQLEERFGVEVHAYCLMGNHFHLLVRSTSGRLSESMQWLSSRFTRSANTARQVDGPIFRGRFHSVSADDPRHRVVLGSYIHANPLDAGWEPPLDRFPWSSLSSYASGTGPAWLHTAELSSISGGVDEMLRSVEGRRTDATPTTDHGQPLANGLSINDVRSAVATMSGVAGAPLRTSQLDALALTMLVDIAEAERSAVTAAFGLTDGATRVALSRGRKLAAGPARSIFSAALDALQLVSDTSCNGRLLRHV